MSDTVKTKEHRARTRRYLQLITVLTRADKALEVIIQTEPLTSSDDKKVRLRREIVDFVDELLDGDWVVRRESRA